MGKINPFKLHESESVNMNDVFRELEIACVTPSDNIFSPFSRKKKEKNQEKIENDERSTTENNEKKSTPSIKAEDMNFDAKTLEVYKKIPVDSPCAIDSLADDGIAMKDVMKALFKLEMNDFIVMLPGEMVSRKRVEFIRF